MSRSPVKTTPPGQIVDTETQCSPPKKVMLNLVDYDGSITPKFKHKSKIFNLNAWLSNNKLLLQNLEKKIKSTLPDRVIFGLGGDGQDYFIDQNKKNQNGSCIFSLSTLQLHFEAIYPRRVFFDPFMMADIYHKDAATRIISSGKSYANIYLETPKNTHAKAPFDENKISLIYAHAHRAALLNPNALIKINFFNDQRDIIIHLFEFFTDHSDLLPNNIELYFYRYNGDQLSWIKRSIDPNFHQQFIQGTGDIDESYDWTTRIMAAIAEEKKDMGVLFDTFLKDPSSLLIAPPESINLFNSFNAGRNKHALLTAREIAQTWDSKISRDGYSTIHEFTKRYGTKILERNAPNSMTPMMDHIPLETGAYSPPASERPDSAVSVDPCDQSISMVAALNLLDECQLPGAIDDDEQDDVARDATPLKPLSREGNLTSFTKIEVDSKESDAEAHSVIEDIHMFDEPTNSPRETDNFPKTDHNDNEQDIATPAPTPLKPLSREENFTSFTKIEVDSKESDAEAHSVTEDSHLFDTPNSPREVDSTNNTKPTTKSTTTPDSLSQNRHTLMYQLPPSTERVMPDSKCGCFGRWFS